jgi:hypothetical protein
VFIKIAHYLDGVVCRRVVLPCTISRLKNNENDSVPNTHLFQKRRLNIVISQRPLKHFLSSCFCHVKKNRFVNGFPGEWKYELQMQIEKEIKSYNILPLFSSDDELGFVNQLLENILQDAINSFFQRKLPNEEFAITYSHSTGNNSFRIVINSSVGNYNKIGLDFQSAIQNVFCNNKIAVEMSNEAVSSSQLISLKDEYCEILGKKKIPNKKLIRQAFEKMFRETRVSTTLLESHENRVPILVFNNDRTWTPTKEEIPEQLKNASVQVLLRCKIYFFDSPDINIEFEPGIIIQKKQLLPLISKNEKTFYGYNSGDFPSNVSLPDFVTIPDENKIKNLYDLILYYQNTIKATISISPEN